MGLDHSLDGGTNPKYKLLCFLTANFFGKEKKALAFNPDRCCHLALCLWLILFHENFIYIIFYPSLQGKLKWGTLNQLF